MEKLSVNSFISFSGDLESDQYRILSGLKNISIHFRKKLLYPALSELIDLAATLDSLVQQKQGLSKSFPKSIKGFDFENKKIIFEDSENLNQNLELLFELIEWASPLIKETIEEGIALYEYVEKNIIIDEVGILPLYKDEGYFMIPDNTINKILIHRFQFTLFRGGNEKYRSLKTRFIKSVEKMLINTPENIKEQIITDYKDILNPATYFCETDLELPFYETLFPVAKRKLLSSIS